MREEDDTMVVAQRVEVSNENPKADTMKMLQLTRVSMPQTQADVEWFIEETGCINADEPTKTFRTKRQGKSNKNSMDKPNRRKKKKDRGVNTLAEKKKNTVDIVQSEKHTEDLGKSFKDI